MIKSTAGGIYIHIPFCRRKCIYCDFYSVGSRLADWGKYVTALLAEAESRLSQGAFEKPTIYIGGGTPSLIPPEEFIRLSEGVRKLAGEHDEFTVEVNPDDVTPELAKLWKEAGVNRVSMGVQSLIDDELRAIGRRHDAYQAEMAYELLKSEFDNISLDIIFGLPGQTHSSLKKTIDGMLSMHPQHLSAYSLMYEERTALTRMRDNGMIYEQADEDVVGMFEYLSRRFEESGYEQYEISNYARPGFRSRHNSSYWSGLPYIGLGAAAHSYDGARERRANVADVRAYIAYWANGMPQEPWNTETLDETDLREEMIMTRLRTKEGIDTQEFRSRFGMKEYESLLRHADEWIKSGYIELNDKGRLALSKSGIMISDEIMASLF